MNTPQKLLLCGCIALGLSACGDSDKVTAPEDSSPAVTANETATPPAPPADDISVTNEEIANNPLLADWSGYPYGLPPFSAIEDDHYMPAVKKGVLELRDEVKAIIDDPRAPDFDNTIVALERSGDTLSQVAYTFSNITNTELNDTLAGLETQIWPMLTKEQDAITLNDDLWQKVRAIYEQRDELGLNEQDARLLELTHRNFVRAGAALAPDVKAQVAEINAEISKLTTQFGQNLLGETKAFKLKVTEEADMAGVSDTLKSALWDEEEKAWMVGLDRSVYEGFMTQSQNRELRSQLFDGYRLRAAAGERDNGPLSIKLAQLRAKRAQLLGYDSHAHYVLEERMAKTPAAAEEFLLKVWRPGLEQAKRERAQMQQMIGDAFQFAGHDWWHQAELLRQAQYAFDGNVLKPYFEMNAVRDGAFEMARRLFNVEIKEVQVPVWNEVVTAYELTDPDGSHVGLFMMDMYARDSKRGGAWMSSYRPASFMDGNNVRPIITNNMNLTTPPDGEPTLMSFDEVETLFHEFGHGLHGLLTRISYPTFSGVSGPTDYTEFPAQILEHWAPQPEMLAIYAKHYQSGDVIPEELIEKMREAKNFNQGFKTTEFIAASLLDLAWHSLSVDEAAKITNAREFEREILTGYGLIDEIEPRYRSQYFSHIFAGGYSAGYYAYLWSEILDADGFQAFREAEDIFDPETAGRLKRWIYEAGGLREADELYRNFRGKDPSIEPLLRGRGFPVGDAAADA